MSIYETIIDIIEEWQDKECGTESEDDLGNIICLGSEIEKVLKENNILQYDYDEQLMFYNPIIDIYSVSVVWVEDGQLKSIVNKIIRRC